MTVSNTHSVEIPYLYLLMRIDLPSMNAGKAIAQGAHAANKFMYFMERSRLKTEDNFNTPNEFANWAIVMDRHFIDYTRWVSSGDGFGTTISLALDHDQIKRIVAASKKLGFISDICVDPSYPFLITKEMASVVDTTKVDVRDEDVKGSAPNIIATREELTCGYVFGKKSELSTLLSGFPLFP